MRLGTHQPVERRSSMPPFRGRSRSIERELPLLISGLLLAAVGIFAWGASRRVHHVVIAAAGQRLQGASIAVDALLAQSMHAYTLQLERVAADPAIIAYLSTGRGAPEARRALTGAWVGDQTARGVLQLRRVDGTIALDTVAVPVRDPSDWPTRLIDSTATTLVAPRVGPLVAAGDSTYSWAVTPVWAPGAAPRPGVAGATTAPARAGPVPRGRLVGFLTDARFLTGQNIQTVRDLIGPGATLLIGSPGEGVWTDLEHRARAPSASDTIFGAPEAVAGPAGQSIGVQAPIPGTPWVLWVGQPRSAVLAPMRRLWAEIAGLAALVIVAGAAAARLLSRRVTRPIVALTASAERVVADSVPESPVGHGGDEVSRLAGAFHRMTGRVTDALATVERARADAEALAGTLQEQTAELEQQTEAAQALSSELEQQVEEAQALAEELERSNQQLQAAAADAEAARRAIGDVVESISDAFIAYDPAWRITFINRGATEYFRQMGIEGPLEGRVVWDLFPETRGTLVDREMHRAMEERVTVTFETMAAGSRWLAIRAYPTRDGGVSAVWTDITDAKRTASANAFLAAASRQLAESLDVETTLRRVAESAVPTLGTWCAVDVIVDPAAGTWPPEVRRLAIMHRDPSEAAFAMEFQRRYPEDWNAPGGLPGVLRTGEASFIPVVTREMLAAMARSDAHLADLERLGFTSVMIVPLVARGRTLGALTLAIADASRRYDEHDLALARNLAERVAIAVDNLSLFRDAEHARLSAEAANRAKVDFLTNMSHELRTPLNAIGGYVQLLEMQVPGPVVEEQRRYLTRIARAQGVLLGRINDILNFAKVDSGTMTYVLRPLALHEALAGTEPLMHPQFAERGIRFEYRGVDPAVTVQADREKLEQILLNLLSNAAKFTPRGGRVTLACAVRQDRVEISVTDTGIGIPTEKLPIVFEPFVQLDPSLTRPHGGTGLGLAISRELARAMGGDLTAESTQDAGSTFTLSLPLAAAEATAAVSDRDSDLELTT